MPRFLKGSEEAKLYMQELRNKRKLKGGGFKDVLNRVVDSGKDFIKSGVKNELNKVVDSGVDYLGKKLTGGRVKKGKGIFGDVLRFGKNQALNFLPMPALVRDVAGYAGDKVIDQSGLGFKKQRKNKKGGALYPAGSYN